MRREVDSSQWGRVPPMNEQTKARVKELHLLLMYLTGWLEESRHNPGIRLFKTWKGYLFRILDELENEHMIRQYKNIQMLNVTEEGLRQAERIKQRFY
ncbi:MAG: transposase [bacterium]|nr:transposase [bacterium]